MNKSIVFFLAVLVFQTIYSAEPYRPSPLVLVHGYAANHYKSSNFGVLSNIGRKKFIVYVGTVHYNIAYWQN